MSKSPIRLLMFAILAARDLVVELQP